MTEMTPTNIHSVFEETSERSKRPPPALVTDDRLTVTFQAHHESYGEEPNSVHWVFADMLESKEQPYKRRLEVDESGMDLELGWLKDKYGLLVVINKAGTKRQVLPTDEEKQEEKKQDLLVFQQGGIPWHIRPGRMFVGEPDTDKIELKSVYGTIPVTVIVFPR